MTKSRYDQMLVDIEKANWMLLHFIHGSASLRGRRQKAKYSRAWNNIDLIRRQAASLHAILTNNELWKCECQAKHTASLRLQPGPPRFVDFTSNRPNPPNRFTLFLSASDEIASSSLQSGWRELDVLPTDFLDSEFDYAPYDTNEGERITRTKGATRIFMPQMHRSESPTTGAATAITSETIVDICSTVFGGGARSSKRNLGFIPHLSRFRPYEADRPCHFFCLVSSQPDVKSASLESFLRESSHRSFGCELSWGERLSIAVTLASSVLQLDGTSWFNKCWSSKDIFLFYQEGQDSPVPGLRNLHPHINRNVPATDTNSLPEIHWPQDIAVRVH